MAVDVSELKLSFWLKKITRIAEKKVLRRIQCNFVIILIDDLDVRETFLKSLLT